MSPSAPHFPFGRPVEARRPSADSARDLFVLGAYPSALHVEWKPPKPFHRVQALAIDNEPEPFWTGHDEAARIDAWKKAVSFDPAWGRVDGAGPLNGSSGLWLEEKVLAPLQVTRAQAWVTDCLDTYRFSTGQESVVTQQFQPFSKTAGLPWDGVPEALRHPDEATIVREALATHRSRLAAELKSAQPSVVVTLGNAAMKVFADLAAVPGLATLTHDRTYGTAIEVTLGGKRATWWPLKHPGQRSAEWQGAHERWTVTRPKTA